MSFMLCSLSMSLMLVTFLDISRVLGESKSLKNRQKEFEDLKSLIFDNAKATVTLDSSALKKLVKLSATAAAPPISIRRVSFSVSLYSKPLVFRTAGQKVVFDKILTNDGNGYNEKTGMFVCPVEGTYMLVADFMARSNNDIRLAVKVNKKTVAQLFRTDNMSNNAAMQFSRTVIMKLKRGDKVEIENENGYVYVYAYNGAYSGFSGTLLY